jgi:ABC-2 type transport system ATP-binding protein
MDSLPAAIRVDRLTKRYDKFTAVDGISFSVPRGEFFGFLGPNGAGKSTTIRVLCGLLDAEFWHIDVAGCDLRTNVLGVKARIGVMLEEPLLYDRLSAREHLIFTGQMYGLTASESARRADDLLKVLDLERDADRLIVDYSQGMRKKAALGCALIHDPPVIFLDEPFNGIDTISSRQIKDLLLQRVAAGATVMFSSHVMEVVEKLCTSVAVIHQGRIVANASLSELKARPGFTGMEDLFIELVGSRALLPAASPPL